MQEVSRQLEPVTTNGHRHILVVEDDRDIAELISRSLATSGYEVTVASRAKDAIDLARTRKPDLITLDIYLPDADGFEVLQYLKTDSVTAAIPVVIVSVMPDQREGLRLGRGGLSDQAHRSGATGVVSESRVARSRQSAGRR